MPNDQPIGVSTTALALTDTANVNDENKRVGVSFGKLIEITGKAVGQTQLKLNQTGARTATQLATTNVDVIAVQELQYDDAGNFKGSNSHKLKLPLINFVDPVFYGWKEVRLRGQFVANEFTSSNETYSSSGSGSGTWNSYGLGIVIGPGSRDSNSKGTSTTTDNDASKDTSWGRIRASALLAPKRDIGVPKPRYVVRGPSLNILAGPAAPINEGDKVTGRSMSACIELRNVDGTAIAGKKLSIEAQGVLWAYAGTEPEDEVTNTDGNLNIVLTRSFVTDDADKSPIGVIVTVRLGLVSNSTTLTF
jgi:hypothetical protein